jgi:hypothetical protein
LLSSDDAYSILRLNASCSRITAIILGYDTPLRVESRRYLVSIELSESWVFMNKPPEKLRVSSSDVSTIGKP